MNRNWAGMLWRSTSQSLKAQGTTWREVAPTQHNSRWLTMLPCVRQVKEPLDAGSGAARPSSSRPGSVPAGDAAGESSGKKGKKRRREEDTVDGAAGASLEGQPDGSARAAGFRAPPSLAAGNPFAALMRHPKAARKTA